MKIKIEQEISNELLSSMLCSGFEGGTGYWCQIQGYEGLKEAKAEFKSLGLRSEDREFKHIWVPITEKGVMLLGEDEEDEGKYEKQHKLTRKKLKKGLQVIASKYPHHMANIVRDNTDAETGDVLIQCALFGDIIYG